ncbi:hypothetical protein D3C77_339600 [compost metagenome]
MFDFIGSQRLNIPAEQSCCDSLGLSQGFLAVHESGHFFGQRNLSLALMRLGLYLLGQRVDRLFIQEREVFQVLDDIAVIGIRPELVELVWRRFLRIEPNRAASRLTKLRTVGLQHKRNR